MAFHFFAGPEGIYDRIKPHNAKQYDQNPQQREIFSLKPLAHSGGIQWGHVRALEKGSYGKGQLDGPSDKENKNKAEYA